MCELGWPARDYFIQVARFDPSKGSFHFYNFSINLSVNALKSLGIPNVIDSYAKFRRLMAQNAKNSSVNDIPQLLICGHGAVDDPDASIIYDQVIHLISSDDYVEFSKDIIVMRLPPSDQRNYPIQFHF